MVLVFNYYMIAVIYGRTKTKKDPKRLTNELKLVCGTK